MQILDIVLYGDEDRIRRIPLRPGKLNIITGASKTGKSALIQIVEYTLGRDEFLIPEGPISQSVRWYGLRLQFNGTQVFIARRGPRDWKSTSTEVFLQVGADLAIPSPSILIGNTIPKDLNEYLTRLLRVSPNLNVPAEDETRRPLQATLRHALFYCFQAQTEIAKNNILFHRQDEAFIPQAIKDTLPYFLGAVEEDRVAKTQEVRQLRRELHAAERRKQETANILGRGLDRGIALLTEAQAVGLASVVVPPPENADDLLKALEAASTWEPQELPGLSEDVLTNLQEEQTRLLEEYRRCSERINAAKNCEEGQKGYAVEVREQQARLATVGLYAVAPNEKYTHCPLCDNQLQDIPPAVNDVVKSLQKITAQLSAVATEQPRLREFIDAQQTQLTDLRRRLGEIRNQMKTLAAQRPEVRELMAMNSQTDRVVGRISLYLESLDEANAQNVAHRAIPETDEIERLHARIAELDASLTENSPEELLLSITNILNQRIALYAQDLNLEFSEYPLRLDLKRLAIIADTLERGPVPLVRIGSGANWVGYHLATHLAIHYWFIQRQRPVPQFLFLDQPTQAYYPQERDSEGSVDVLGDSDRVIVRQMFEWLVKTVKVLAPDLQVIVMDHADLLDDWFAECVVQRWREGKKLIPQDWITVGP